jgi:SAM-dependent methyltransferase
MGREPGRALDLGCGTATNVITLAQHGWQVTGVDFARTAIGMARRKARRAGVEVDLRVGDVTKEGIAGGVYDLVLDMRCFHSLTLEGRAAYARNLGRLMSPGGTFLLYVFVKRGDEVEGGGVPESELTALTEMLELVAWEDGTNRGRRPSAWLTFRKR